jgi:6-pyruvoyl tetrahydropterin synthase/QueD family protein
VISDKSMPSNANFSIHVAKENLKFSAAHFIAYPGFREPLHGHNYQVGVYVEGRLAKTGYVIDFGLIKKLTKEIVDRLDERTIVPGNSDCLTIDASTNGVVRIRYEHDEFVLPAADVCIVPIVHSSADELATALRSRGALTDVTTMEISVAEGPGQSAHYRNSTGD